jgi:hypothetical protein
MSALHSLVGAVSSTLGLKANSKTPTAETLWQLGIISASGESLAKVNLPGGSNFRMKTYDTGVVRWATNDPRDISNSVSGEAPGGSSFKMSSRTQDLTLDVPKSGATTTWDIAKNQAVYERTSSTRGVTVERARPFQPGAEESAA